MGVSKNRGTPKSSILIGFSLINPFWGTTIFGNNTLLQNEESVEPDIFTHFFLGKKQEVEPDINLWIP